MGKIFLSDQDFARLFKEVVPRRLAKKIGVNYRNVMRRRQEIEDRYQINIAAPAKAVFNSELHPTQVSHPYRISLAVNNGTVLVGSDRHVWPGKTPIAMRAFIHFCKEYTPQAVILNGDVIDAGMISRHPPINWESRPTVQDEIEAAQEELSAIELAAPRGCNLVWNLGNHDSRFETRLATVAPEFARIHGMHLKDHFPHWRPAWSTWVNNDVVVKHRFKGGIHAPHNNTMWSGKTIVTGHLHSAKVIPFTDYNGDRYGVDTGCLADISSDAFVHYTEDNPKNWRSAFCVLTFVNGVLLQPELVLVYDHERVQFRGQLIAIPGTQASRTSKSAKDKIVGPKARGNR